MKVTKAVIAAAGFGTRFIPATKALPKEMLPIVDKPIIQYLVEEAVASGITDIIIVTRSGSQTLENHFDCSHELESHLTSQNKLKLLEQVKKISELANIAYVRQEKNRPYGNGTPLLSAKPFINADETIAYMFGDDIILSSVPGLKQLIDVYNKYTPAAVIAVQKKPLDEIGAYAIPKFKPGTDRNEIESIIEKPTPEEITSDLAQLGRFIISPSVIRALETQEPGRGQELWLTDAFDNVAKSESVIVHELQGRWFTTGDPLNFLKTTVAFALKNNCIGQSFADYLHQLGF
jgi:UTP--glucose-1-phosphate uridylyltransferase